MSRFDKHEDANDNFEILHEGKKNKGKKYQFSIYINEETLKKLDYMCEHINKIGKVKRSDMIAYLIDKYSIEEDSFNL